MYTHAIGNSGCNAGEINTKKFIEQITPWDFECERPTFKTKQDGKFVLAFRKVNETKHYNESKEYTHSTYTRDNYVDVKDEEGNVTGKENVPEDFTDEMNDILAEIQKCIDEHDPAPTKTPVSEQEKMWDCINYLMLNG